MEHYAENCMPNSLSQSFAIMIFTTILKNAGTLCDTTTGLPTKQQALLLESAKCSNSVKDAHQKCTNMGINYMLDAAKMNNFNYRLAHICW